MFPGSFKDILRKFQGGLKKMSSVCSRKFQKESFKGVSIMFQWNFVLQFCCGMNLIAAIRAEGGFVLEHSWAPKSTYDRPWALLCTDTLKSMMSWCQQCSWGIISAHWVLWVHKCLVKKQTKNILSFGMTSPYYFVNILLVNISPNNEKWIFSKSTRKGCWKMSKMEFLDPREMRNPKNKSE